MSPSLSHDEVLRRLKDELDQAQANYSAACTRFDSMIKATAAGFAPKGNRRLRKAGDDSMAALQNYNEALKRYTDFTVSGIAPKDLPPLK